jgi:hypothetical protein
MQLATRLVAALTFLASIAVIDDAQAATCRITEVGATTIACGEKVAVKVGDENDKAALARLKVGTIIEQPTVGTSASDIKVAKAPVSGLVTPIALLFGLVLAFVYGWLVSGSAQLPAGYSCRLWALVIGQDGRYSNSKVQATAWMAVLLVAYMSTCFIRWWSDMPWQDASSVGISDNLLAMAGLSATAAGGAKIATATKVASAASEVKSGAAPNFWVDLFHNDAGDWDIGDAQMILVTAFAIALFVVNMTTFWMDLPLAAHIDLPSPTNALTFAFGGSLGGYLAKKIGGTVGQS